MDSSYIHGEFVPNLAWIFLPKCELRCQIPEGRSGQGSKAIVKVTKCHSQSPARLTAISCDNPIYHHVTKDGGSMDIDMVYFGYDLCFSVDIVKEKYTRRRRQDVNDKGFTHRECKEFCLNQDNDYQMIVTKESLIYQEEDIFVEQEIFKFKLVDVEM